jgi:four helix bundle protein
MKITKFEDLDCWKEARILVNIVYQHIRSELFRKDYRLRDQITGAAISVMSNIADGFDSQSNNEFVRFLRYSRRSISEVQSCTYIAFDQKYITEQERKKLYDHCSKVRKIVDGFIRYLRSK